jgi:nucleoside-diphosphate-sugar epimerase
VKVFVTGAAGFIGRNLLPGLARAGHETTALLLPDEAEAGLAAGCIVRGDITEPRGLESHLVGHDAVVHLAAAVGYGQTMQRCLRINRDGTRNVVHAAVRAGARRFVQLSSVSVYGRSTGACVDEDTPLQRTGDPYGDTKIEAESILQWHAARGEIDLTILRPTVIYGPGDDKFLPKLVENLKSGRARVIGDGSHRVDAIHVDDVVACIVRVLDEPRAFGRVYNLNHGGNPSWREFVACAAVALGLPPTERHLPYRMALLLAGVLEGWARLRGGEPLLSRYAVRVVGRPYHYATDRAKIELGFEPRIDLREGVRRWIETAGADPPPG